MNRPRIGLALGGGGARGLAHIGVLKVFEEENLPIDCLSGASMGGIIAAAYAAGLSAAQLESIALKMADLRMMFKLMDVNPRRRGLVEGKYVRAFLIQHLCAVDVCFEQLRLPVAVTATDFVRGKTVILNSGPVIEAIMATSAFPGIFQPVYTQDRLLMDGGMLDNVPAGAARQLGAEVVIAVCVTPCYPRQEVPLKQYQTRLLPAIFPPFSEEIYRAAMIMSAEITRIRLQESHPELVLVPEIPDDLSIFLGFPRAQEIIAMGEKAARQALPQIKKIVEVAENGL